MNQLFAREPTEPLQESTLFPAAPVIDIWSCDPSLIQKRTEEQEKKLDEALSQMFGRKIERAK